MIVREFRSCSHLHSASSILQYHDTLRCSNNKVPVYTRIIIHRIAVLINPAKLHEHSAIQYTLYPYDLMMLANSFVSLADRSNAGRRCCAHKPSAMLSPGLVRGSSQSRSTETTNDYAFTALGASQPSGLARNDTFTLLSAEEGLQEDGLNNASIPPSLLPGSLLVYAEAARHFYRSAESNSHAQLVAMATATLGLAAKKTTGLAKGGPRRPTDAVLPIVVPPSEYAWSVCSDGSKV